MKVRRILLLLAALALVAAGSPTAAGAAIAPAATHEATGTASGNATERVAATHAAPPAVHRTGLTAPGMGRRLGFGGGERGVLGADHPYVTARGTVAGIDASPDARLLRAANAPSGVRGPPSSS